MQDFHSIMQVFGFLSPSPLTFTCLRPSPTFPPFPVCVVGCFPSPSDAAAAFDAQRGCRFGRVAWRDGVLIVDAASAEAETSGFEM